jgi:phosphonate transport system substrate-binding protein
VRTIRFGVSRSHGGSLQLERFVNVLARELRLPVRPIIARDYEHLLEGVLVSGIDLAWMPPLLHARAVEHDAILAAVVQRSPELTYRAAILCRNDSAFHKIEELQGARAAWSDRASASGYLFPKLHLLSAGVGGLEESFHGSTESAMTAVREHKADVCASFIGEEKFPELRVLDITAPIPPDGLVLAPGLDGKLQARVRDLLLVLHEKPGGGEALRRLFDGERLVPVTSPISRLVEQLRALAQKHL